MTKKFNVQVKMPDGVSVEDMKAYILDAVSCWRGSLQPQVDPLFDLDPNKVKVTLSRKRVKKNG